MKNILILIFGLTLTACASEPKYLVRDDLGYLREVTKVSDDKAVIFQDSHLAEDSAIVEEAEVLEKEVYQEVERCREQKKLIRKFKNEKGEMVYEYEHLAPLCVE